MTSTNQEVPLKQIVSDHNRQIYVFPHVQSPLDITFDDIEAKILALKDMPAGKDGLYGFHLSPKQRERIIADGEEFYGLEWITNINNSKSALKEGVLYHRQAKLLRKNHNQKNCANKYFEDAAFTRFCVHPSTGELLIDLPHHQYTSHTEIIETFGTHNYEEYLRLVYRGIDKNTGVLLSRAYYNFNNSCEYDFSIDKEVNLNILALLLKNKLPSDTVLFLSAPRDIFRRYGFL